MEIDLLTDSAPMVVGPFIIWNSNMIDLWFLLKKQLVVLLFLEETL